MSKGNIIRSIGSFFSFIYPYQLHRKICLIHDLIHTGWIAHQISSIGEGSIIERNLYLVGGQHIKIGKLCVIGRYSFITAFGDDDETTIIEIGDHCQFGSDLHITCSSHITIGNHLRTGKSVLISDNSHGNTTSKNVLEVPPSLRPIVSKGPIVIEDNVWIGEKAAILSGVHIGKGAIIGANSVVTHDVPDYGIVAGVPARLVRIAE